MAPAVLWGFTFCCSCCDATVLAIAETKDLCILTQKMCFFLGWFDSPEAIHIKPVWRNESRSLAAVRGERRKRNWIGSRRMSDWQQESRVHERVPILVIYEHTIFELWRWVFFVFWELFWVKLLLDVLTKKNHIWSLCRRIISSDSQLVAEVWIYRCLEPCTNQEPYPKHGKFKHGISYHLFRTQQGKSAAGPPKR